MKLIAGLGNPGRQYVGTRHNVGYDVVDVLARRIGWLSGSADFERMARSGFDGLTMTGVVGLSSGVSERLLLLKPATFMNLSGRSVQAAMAFYQLPPQDVLIVLDDVALPVGRIRVRPGGSSGGHNGLKDIERALGTDQYPRLRVGIDAPPPRIPQRDYVLSAMSAAQRKAFEPALDRAAAAALVWMESGVESAMNQFNPDAASKDKEEPK